MNTIEAIEGRYLTQTSEVEESERIYVKKVAGADPDLADKWRDASPEEKEQHDQKMKEMEEETFPYQI